MHKNLIVFDIETVPDYETAGNLLNLKGASDSELREALTKYHLDLTDGKNSFYRQPFHKIIAISFLEAEVIAEDGYFSFKVNSLRSGGNINSSEYDLVAGFFNLISSKKPTLVSYNGRTFDMPVLKYRAMKHKITAAAFHKSGDKWNNYGSRYSLDWHCDLLEALSDFGASSRVKLNEVCALLSLPGKFNIDGSDVETYFNNGRLQDIRNYCEIDVANTFLVYLSYCLHTGLINKDAFEQSLASFLDTILASSNPLLAEFAELLGQGNF